MVMQIELTDEQTRALQELAARKGQSVPDLIRASVSALLQSEAPVDREETKRRAIAAIGRFQSDATDLATEHDRYLDEAYGD